MHDSPIRRSPGRILSIPVGLLTRAGCVYIDETYLVSWGHLIVYWSKEYTSVSQQEGGREQGIYYWVKKCRERLNRREKKNNASLMMMMVTFAKRFSRVTLHYIYYLYSITVYIMFFVYLQQIKKKAKTEGKTCHAKTMLSLEKPINTPHVPLRQITEE